MTSSTRGKLRGRRLPDAVIGEAGPGWDAWKVKQPGDYMRVDFGKSVGWYICDPTGEIGLVGLPRVDLERATFTDALVPVVQPPIVEPWTIVEHDDGTISVTPSIMDPGGWHGYLTRGDWVPA